MIVAVAVPCSPPPQHSPILGQRASSQTYERNQHCVENAPQVLKQCLMCTICALHSITKTRTIYVTPKPQGTSYKSSISQQISMWL